MTVRIRGIYATALTELLGDDGTNDGGTDDHGDGGDETDPLGVVQASGAIDDRFSEREFPTAPARASIETTGDRQGVGVIGDQETVTDVVATLCEVGIDALVWRDPTPRGAIFDGKVSETLGSGAVVDLGAQDEATTDDHLEDVLLAAGDREGFLPFRNADDRIEDGDRVRVQVREPVPPWADDRPLLDTTVRVDGSLLTLQRGGVAGTGGPHLGDVLPIDPPAGWGVRWAAESEDASLDGLGDALERANERAATIDDALSDVAASDDDSAGQIHAGDATAWVWFGRESRFALDVIRRNTTPTMPGHHRVKAGADAASAAVDFVEALAPDLAAESAAAVEFPFGVVSEHFGPTAGETVAIHHGKPDGRLLTLGRADVEGVDSDGTVTIRREMASSGTYDGLGTERERGDVATTKIVEGRWWYPTNYRSDDGDLRGTYVNVCTPVEVFPDAVRYVDLHVDVVKRPDGTVERLDDDELDAAEDAGYLSAELAKKARAVASAVENAL